MIRSSTFLLFIYLFLAGCDMPIDVVSIKDNENREYFKQLLNDENIPFVVSVKNGQEELGVEREYSKRVHALLSEYGGRSLEPGRAVCYRDENPLSKEVNKLNSVNAKYSLVKNYAYTCISWKEEDASHVESILYK